MRYLLISDIHSNLEALEASLQAAERLETGHENHGVAPGPVATRRREW